MKNTIAIILLSMSFIFNDTVVKGYGAAVFPIKSVNIQMVTDSVMIQRGGNLGWAVKVKSTFKNFGPDTTVQIGFPFDRSSPDFSEDDTSFKVDFDPEFEAYVNDKQASVLLRKGVKGREGDLSYDFLYVFDVHFNIGEEKTIEQYYTVGGSSSSTGDEEFTYILKTGSLWRNSIESLWINVSLSESDIDYWNSISPKPHIKRENKNKFDLVWSYKDIKPDFDVIVQHGAP